MPANPNRLARVLVSGGALILVLGFILSEVGYVSTGECPVPPICQAPVVSHPFNTEAIIVAFIGIALIIFGFVLASQSRTLKQPVVDKK